MVAFSGFRVFARNDKLPSSPRHSREKRESTFPVIPTPSTEGRGTL